MTIKLMIGFESFAGCTMVGGCVPVPHLVETRECDGGLCVRVAQRFWRCARSAEERD